MKSWENVFKTCDWKCVYCGVSLADDFRLYDCSCEDHLFPLAAGGSCGIENRVASCQNCNLFKGVYCDETFRGIKRTPRGKKYVDDFRGEPDPEYLMGVIAEIIEHAKKRLDELLKTIPATQTDKLTKSAEAYIDALNKRYDELRQKALGKNTKQKMRNLDD
jgi:hypothetical protein